MRVSDIAVTHELGDAIQAVVSQDPVGNTATAVDRYISDFA